MKKLIIFLFLLIVLNHLLVFSTSSRITYNFSGGRFGDNLIAYCHAKWLSYKYKIPLLYKPFDYSDRLALHNLEEKFEDNSLNKFKKSILVENLDQISKEENTLFIIPYFSESHFEKTWFKLTFRVNWQDNIFKSKLKKFLKPLIKVPEFKFPKNHLSIAVHVRKGTGVDEEINFKLFPLKFPNDYFYISQIKYIADNFRNRSIYIYLFTDHDKPEELVNKYKSFLKNSNIVFEYRKEKNLHNLNVVEDFFSMMQFDCLIRPESSFSIMAAKLSNYIIEAFPWSMKEINNERLIDKVKIINKLRDTIIINEI